MGPPAPAMGQSGKPNTNINFLISCVFRVTITPRLTDNQSWNEIHETAALATFDTPLSSEMNESLQTF